MATSDLCPRCHGAPKWRGHSYCQECWRLYQREHYAKRRRNALANKDKFDNPDLPPERVCPHCGTSKPLAEWHKQVRTDGSYTYNSRCLECYRDYCREYRAKNRERLSENKRASRDRITFKAQLDSDLRFYDKALALQRAVRRMRGDAA